MMFERSNRLTLSASHLAMFMAGFLWFIALSSVAQAFETVAREAIVIDAETGAVLLEKNADILTPPSSMTKMMTTYMVFERLKGGSLSLEDRFPVSEKAWRKGGSKMFVKVKDRVRIEDLIRGIAVQSGNDACIVVAEGLAGDEATFAAEMTQRAREIGLEKSVFKNASGWPEEGHLVTVRDLATLALRTIKDFPEYYHYYSEKSFTYSGIKQNNRNPLLYKDMGADGIKTGHTEIAGYGLVGTAERNGRRIVAVLNGLSSAKSRSTESERIVEWAFREFNNYALFKAGEEVLSADVWLGHKPRVPLLIEGDLKITLPRKARRTMKVSVKYESPIPAPIRKGDRLATLVIAGKGIDKIEIPLVSGEEIERLGLVGRLGAALKFILWGASG